MQPRFLFMAVILGFSISAPIVAHSAAFPLNPVLTTQAPANVSPAAYYHRGGGYYHRGGYYRGGGYYRRGGYYRGGTYYRGGGYYRRGGGCRWVSVRTRGPYGWTVRRVRRCY